VNFYEVCILKSPLKTLAYSYDKSIEIGCEVLVPLAHRKDMQAAVVLKKIDKPPFVCKDIFEVGFVYSKYMIEVARFISDYYVCSIGEAIGLFYAYDKNIKYKSIQKTFKDTKNLTENQQKAYEFVDSHNISLLFGDTGSGKTVLYLKAIEKILKQNLQALFLIPEISLTPQMQQRVQEIFGEYVAVWHSKITKKNKQTILNNIQSGDTRVVVGARSALFLPYAKLGLIIVDEEHDMSYKADKKPRYNAKDIAIYIASKYNIKLIAGSATPSITSFYKLPYIRLEQKYFKNKNKIILTKNTNIEYDIFSNKIEQNLKNNGQIMVFVPIRANFKYQVCSDCGKAVECPYCSVSMSLYTISKAIKCHYCGYIEPIPDICPSCKVGVITNNIVGTAQVAKQLQQMYTNKVIKQFDRDKIKTNNQLKKVLEEFNDNKIDVLVGTSMLSKGHDYHNVNLVIILGLDSILNMDSFVARQLAITMAIQVAGRAGRKNQGEVIISTKNREFFDYYLNQSDYKEFLTNEIEYRKELYPPKIRVAKIVCSHKNQAKAKQNMDMVVAKIDKKQYPNIQIIKADICKIAKIANRFRYELVIRSKDVKQLLSFLHTINKTEYMIDMDSTI